MTHVFSKYILLAALCIGLFSSTLCAQNSRESPINLGGWDQRRYHFGVQLSVNSADYTMDKRFDPAFESSLFSLQNTSRPGFNIAIVTSLKITDNLSLRFIPGISPKERSLNYVFLNEQGREEAFEKIVSSFYIDLPLLVKYRTDRINNFAAYVIAGGQMSRDMSSQINVNNVQSSLDDQVIKTIRWDPQATVGGGFDFFLPYFKFGLELKMSQGLKNILLQDNTKFSSPIESLRSKNWVISLTFEG